MRLPHSINPFADMVSKHGCDYFLTLNAHYIKKNGKTVIIPYKFLLPLLESGDIFTIETMFINACNGVSNV